MPKISTANIRRLGGKLMTISDALGCDVSRLFLSHQPEYETMAKELGEFSKRLEIIGRAMQRLEQ